MKTIYYTLLLYIITYNNSLATPTKDRDLVNWIFYGDETKDHDLHVPLAGLHLHDHNAGYPIHEIVQQSSSSYSVFEELSHLLPPTTSYSPASSSQTYESSYLHPLSPPTYEPSHLPPSSLPTYDISNLPPSSPPTHESSNSIPPISFQNPSLPLQLPPVPLEISPIPLQMPTLSSPIPMPYQPAYDMLSQRPSRQRSRQSNTPPEDCKCGVIQQRRSRIYLGNTTLHENYPWLARIRKHHNFSLETASIRECVGSLITMLHILSVAHCFGEGYSHGHATLSDGRIYNLGKVLIHEKFVPFAHPLKFDVALVFLKKRARFGSPIGPICLPRRDEEFYGRTAIAAGWGLLSEGGPETDELHQVDLPILTPFQCHKSDYLFTVPDHMFCAGYLNGGPDTCCGDSGAPVMVRGAEDEFIAAGLVSYGEGSGRPRYPGINIKPSRFLQWITNRIGNERLCARP